MSGLQLVGTFSFMYLYAYQNWLNWFHCVWFMDHINNENIRQIKYRRKNVRRTSSFFNKMSPFINIGEGLFGWTLERGCWGGHRRWAVRVDIGEGLFGVDIGEGLFGVDIGEGLLGWT